MKRSFSSSDAKIGYNGREIVEFKKISYSCKDNVALNKTGNNRSTSFSIGDEELTCSLELYMSELNLLEKEAKEKTGSSKLSGLGEISFAVTFLNKDNDEVTDIVNFVITSNGREIAGGSEGLAYAVDCTATGVYLNVS